MPKPNGRVPQSRQKICLLCFAITCAITIVVGVIIGWFLRVRSFSAVDIIHDNSTRFLSLSAELLLVDPASSTFVMNWQVEDDSCYGGVDSDDIPITQVPATCNTVNIYFDQNLKSKLGDGAETNRTNTQPSDPVFIWDPVANLLTESSLPAFQSTINMFTKGGDSKDHTLQDYPEDLYISLITVFANDTNNNPVHLYKTSTTGVAVGFNAEVEPDLDPSLEGVIVDVITFKRSALVKAYVYLIVIGVWFITLIFLGSVVKEMFGYRQPIEAYAVPLATIFAITSVRGSMPGAPPGFGAIVDFVGILPCLAIIILTGLVLFIVMIHIEADGAPSSTKEKSIHHSDDRTEIF